MHFCTSEIELIGPNSAYIGLLMDHTVEISWHHVHQPKVVHKDIKFAATGAEPIRAMSTHKHFGTT